MERDTTTTVMEAVNFTNITKRIVLGQDPSELIDFLNAFYSRKLNPKNEYHFEVAQDLIDLYITNN